MRRIPRGSGGLQAPSRWPAKPPAEPVAPRIEPGWHFPWPDRGKSAYDDGGPGVGSDLTFVMLGVLFRVTATGDEGIHTCRPRYFVKCISCSIVMHRNTTGPDSHIAHHLHDKHNISIGFYAERSRDKNNWLP